MVGKNKSNNLTRLPSGMKIIEPVGEIQALRSALLANVLLRNEIPETEITIVDMSTAQLESEISSVTNPGRK